MECKNKFVLKNKKKNIENKLVVINREKEGKSEEYVTEA